MSTAIVYYSQHHGNTKKLVDAIAAQAEVTVFNVLEDRDADLTPFDRVGFASGIYYGAFAKQLLAFARERLPAGREVFFLSTCGAPREGNFSAIRKIAGEKQCRELGAYQCLGFDTFGPFRLVGGLAKGHPTDEEIAGAVRFYQGIE